MLISHCESCDRGYHVGYHSCPWCGAPQWLSFTEKPVDRTLDIETYKNWWYCRMCTAEGEVSEFEMYPGQSPDLVGLHRVLTQSRIITFNGNHYDVPVLTLALAGANNE